MDNNSEKIIELFHEISKKGYIKSISNNWGSIGLTFENEIGKKPDSEYLPDFNDIEIKCSTRFSRYPLYLFTIAFDSGIDETLRIANKFGYYDKDFPDKKVLYERISNNPNYNKDYSYTFDIDESNQKLYLCIFDSLGNLVERQSYIYFSSLIQHIETKLNKIAYIKASTQTFDNIKHYRYYAIYMLKIKDFNTFLDLIKQDKLYIEIIARINKSGRDKGRYRCKNIVFSIDKKYIPKLFDCYYQYNYDNEY